MKPVVKLHKYGSPKKGGFSHYECLNPKCEYYQMSVQKYNLPGGVCPGCDGKVSAFQ